MILYSTVGTSDMERAIRFYDSVWSCPGSVDSFSSSFLDLVSIDLTPAAQSVAAGGRSSGRIFSSVRRKSTAYKAPGTEISSDPWGWHPSLFAVASI